MRVASGKAVVSIKLSVECKVVGTQCKGQDNEVDDEEN